MDEKQIAEIRAKHGTDLQGFDLPNDKTVIFRRPTRFEYDRFVDSASENNKTTPIRELAKSCLAYPSEQEFDEILDTYPAIVGNEIIHVLRKLAGYYEEITIKKF